MTDIASIGTTIKKYAGIGVIDKERTRHNRRVLYSFSGSHSKGSSLIVSPRLLCFRAVLLKVARFPAPKTGTGYTRVGGCGFGSGCFLGGRLAEAGGVPFLFAVENSAFRGKRRCGGNCTCCTLGGSRSMVLVDKGQQR